MKKINTYVSKTNKPLTLVNRRLRLKANPFWVPTVHCGSSGHWSMVFADSLKCRLPICIFKRNKFIKVQCMNKNKNCVSDFHV